MSPEYNARRETAWLGHAKKVGLPLHNDTGHGGGGRNNWQLTFYAGYDACHSDDLERAMED